MPREKWEIEFDKKFIGGFTTQTIHKVVTNNMFGSDIEINRSHIKSFIKEVIEQAKEEERERIIKSIENIKSCKDCSCDLDKEHVMSMISNKL